MGHVFQLYLMRSFSCDIPFCQFCLHSVLLHIEQYTEEQQDVQASAGVVTDLDTKALESSEEATQSEDSVSLSVVDNVSEIFLHESIPDEVTIDVSIEGDSKVQGKEDYSQFTAGK